MNWYKNVLKATIGSPGPGSEQTEGAAALGCHQHSLRWDAGTE